MGLETLAGANSADQGLSSIVTAEVESITGGVLRVTVPSFSRIRDFQLARWVGDLGPGDEILIGFDETGEPWQISEGTPTSLYLTADFLPVADEPNRGQMTIAPIATTTPEGVATITLVPNNEPHSGPGWQARDAIIAFHPRREHVEDATIKCHQHTDADGVAWDEHIQIHTKNAAGDNLISRMEWQFGADIAYIRITSAYLDFDANAYMKINAAGLPIRSSADVEIFEFEDSGVLKFSAAGVFSNTAAAGATHTVPTVCSKYLVIRDSGGTLRKIALFD